MQTESTCSTTKDSLINSAAPFPASAFAPLAKCDGVLASSRLEKAGKLYYLALFKTSDRKQLVALTSVAANGRIEVEKTLAESINRGGTTADVKTVKAALVRKMN